MLIYLECTKKLAILVASSSATKMLNLNLDCLPLGKNTVAWNN